MATGHLSQAAAPPAAAESGKTGLAGRLLPLVEFLAEKHSRYFECASVLLRHGTTRKRAEAILRDGPNPRYVEEHSPSETEGFSTAPLEGFFGFGRPEAHARSKARLFPKEGGPAILEFELPDDVAEAIIGNVQNPMEEGKALNWGDEIAFDVGHGIEELLAIWPRLTKRICSPED